MATKTEFLERHVLMSLRNIAPEKKDALEKLIQDQPISFIIEPDAPRIRFAADLAKKEIKIGRPCLDRLWALAFGYYRFYRAISQQKLKDVKVREIDLTQTAELRQAGGLLKWAIEADLKAKAGEAIPPWPDGLPFPRDGDAKLSDENCATELFLSATGYILHHELAHIRLNHRPYAELQPHEAIQQEKEADFAASDWLLDGLDDELDPAFQKRALGICLGTLWITALYVYAGRKIESKTHPPAYDRLFQVVSRHVHDGGNLPWAFLTTALDLHLQNQQIPHDQNREFESFKDAADYAVDVISKMYSK